MRVSAVYATALLPVIALAAYRMGLKPIEYWLFGPSGANLLTGNWGRVFVNPKVQAGPFEVLPYGVAHLFGLRTELQWFVFYLIVLWAVTFALALVMFLPLRTVTGALGRYLSLGILAVALLGFFLPTVVMEGHPAELVIPLLWLVAGCLSRERMFAAAGVTIGLSMGFEVWGVLGVPVLFLVASPRIIRAGVAAVITVGVIYVPFVLTGTFRMFEYHWVVSNGTLYRSIWPNLSAFPWTFRLAQAVLAVAAGIVVAVVVRRSGYGIWLVPLAIISVRLVFDPLLDFYYWMAPATVALCALGSLLYQRKWIAAVVPASLIAFLWIPPTRSVEAAISMTVLAALCVAAILVADRGGRLRPMDVDTIAIRPRDTITS